MIKIRSAVLETVCGVTSTLPETTMAEAAFAGKSNVGKSSLINALMQRKSLARTSSQPGKTQTINYYHVNAGTKGEETEGDNPFAPDVYLVDLPGYGYANIPDSVRAAWGRMIEGYLNRSAMLKVVFLLVDMRHAPSANDRMMYKWIVESGRTPVVVATKKDKLKRSQLQKAVKDIRAGLGAAGDVRVIAFSAVTKEGAEEIWGVIRDMCIPAGDGGEDGNTESRPDGL